MAIPAVAAAPSLWGPALGGLLGGISSGLFGQHSVNRQIDFQREMSNTAHQREVADLRAAGLNPMLSVNAGASSPTGASQAPPDLISPMLQMASLKKMEAETANIQTQTRSTAKDVESGSFWSKFLPEGLAQSLKSGAQKGIQSRPIKDFNNSTLRSFGVKGNLP